MESDAVHELNIDVRLSGFSISENEAKLLKVVCIPWYIGSYITSLYTGKTTRQLHF